MVAGRTCGVDSPNLGLSYFTIHLLSCFIKESRYKSQIGLCELSKFVDIHYVGRLFWKS